MKRIYRVLIMPGTDPRHDERRPYGRRPRPDGGTMYAPQWGYIDADGAAAWEALTSWPIPSRGSAESHAREAAARAGAPFLGVVREIER